MFIESNISRRDRQGRHFLPSEGTDLCVSVTQDQDSAFTLIVEAQIPSWVPWQPHATVTREGKQQRVRRGAQ